MAKKPRLGYCAYCGEHGEITLDHVPPKCLFPPDTRTNLVTVPACPECHSTFKLDDEYFRVALALRADLPSGTSADFLRSQTNKAFRDPFAQKFRDAIKATIRTSEVRTLGGIYLGTTPTFEVSAARVTRTTERIVRGLYAKYLKKPVPETHDVSVCIIDFQRDSSAIDDPQVQEVIKSIAQYGRHKKFGDAFELRFVQIEEDPDSTGWWLRLHGVFGVLAFTLPRPD